VASSKSNAEKLASNTISNNINKSSPKKINSLKKRSDFLNLIKSGKKIFPCKWLFISYVPNNLGLLRFGWTVSRQIGSAVVRNKLKRWCRDFFTSKDKTEISGFDINVIFRPCDKDFYKNVSHVEVSVQLQKAWKKIILGSKEWK
jgi:ribonuclease P protein component